MTLDQYIEWAVENTRSFEGELEVGADIEEEPAKRLVGAMAA
jgi:hypothetical protein